MGSKATHVTLSYHLCYVAATVGEKKSAKSRGAVSPGGTSDPNDPDDPGETQPGVPGDPGAPAGSPTNPSGDGPDGLG